VNFVSYTLNVSAAIMTSSQQQISYTAISSNKFAVQLMQLEVTQNVSWSMFKNSIQGSIFPQFISKCNWESLHWNGSH